MDGRVGGRRWSGEPAGRRAGKRRRGGRRSHTGQDDCSGVCQLRRVPSGRSPSKRRRFREIRGSPASSASLLHGRAGRRHCSPAHPVSPAGNPGQTHTKAPSGPVRIPEPISLCTLGGIRRLYTRSKAMLRSYVSEKFGTDRLIRRREIRSQIGRRSTLCAQFVSPAAGCGARIRGTAGGEAATVGCGGIGRTRFNVGR